MAIFTGAGVAIVTPMKEGTKEVDYDAYGKLIDYQIEHGTDAIVACGTTGESATLSEKEHMEVIQYAIDYVNKRVPVIAGTGSNSTETAIELSKDARRMGADGLLVVTPYYNKCTQKGMYEHYKQIALAVDDTPIIMYNLSLESKTMQLAEGCLDMYSGEDGLIVPLMSIGAKGVISVLSNVAPQQTHDICAEFLAGNIEKARELQFKALPLVDALFCEVNPIPVKKALELMGFQVGPLRMPLTEMEPANVERLRKAMQDYGIL